MGIIALKSHIQRHHLQRLMSLKGIILEMTTLHPSYSHAMALLLDIHVQTETTHVILLDAIKQ